jgi:hypothetical protein
LLALCTGWSWSLNQRHLSLRVRAVYLQIHLIGTLSNLGDTCTLRLSVLLIWRCGSNRPLLLLSLLRLWVLRLLLLYRDVFIRGTHIRMSVLRYLLIKMLLMVNLFLVRVSGCCQSSVMLACWRSKSRRRQIYWSLGLLVG